MFKTLRIDVLLEILGFVAFALISKALVTALTWKFAGPITLITTLVLLTVYLRIRRRSWSEFGLVPVPGIKAKLLLIPKAFLVFLAFALAVGSILGAAELFQIGFLTEVPEGVDARFGEVKDNLPMYIMWLGIVWTSAAFGEEMFFRGYLVTRMQEAWQGSRLASVIAVVFAAAIFGYGHMYYQGWRGFVITGAIGLAFGIMFLFYKKNLWPLILMHGLIDTATFTGQYLGLE